MSPRMIHGGEHGCKKQPMGASGRPIGAAGGARRIRTTIRGGIITIAKSTRGKGRERSTTTRRCGEEKGKVEKKRNLATESIVIGSPDNYCWRLRAAREGEFGEREMEVAVKLRHASLSRSVSPSGCNLGPLFVFFSRKPCGLIDAGLPLRPK